MKPEDQITALAKWDGWTWNLSSDVGGKAFPECWTHDDHGFAWTDRELPNYLSDLNAVRPLLLKLNTKQQEVFAYYVSDFADSPEAKTRYDEDDYFGYIEVPADFAFKMLTLSPELLCKALLNTLKLWV